MKRVLALALAILLSAHLTLTPARAVAPVATGLAVVGGAVAITAFLDACGIYPFNDDGYGSYQDGLSSLLESYNASGVANNLTVTEEVIKAYLVNGAIAVAKDSWARLRSFASWVVSHFSVADNQTGLQLGSVSGPAVELPVFDAYPSYTALRTRGLQLPGNTGTRTSWVGASVRGVYLYALRSDYPDIIPFCGVDAYSNALTVYKMMLEASDTSGSVQTLSRPLFQSLYHDGVLYGYYAPGTFIQTVLSRLPEVESLGIPVYASHSDAMAYMWDVLSGNLSDSGGVSVDTGAVSIPDALPQDAQFGGLAVPGVSSVAGVGVVEDVIEQGVTDRLQPGVRVVDVTVATGTEVDAETGAVVDTAPVEISPASVPINPADYQTPDLTGVFPFSIPWDIYRLLQALDADPVRPAFVGRLVIPALGDAYEFAIDVPSDVAMQIDDFALLFRRFLLVLVCIGVLFALAHFIRF